MIYMDTHSISEEEFIYEHFIKFYSDLANEVNVKEIHSGGWSQTEFNYFMEMIMQVALFTSLCQYLNTHRDYYSINMSIFS